MLRPDDLWFLDDGEEEPSALLRVLPEIRQYVVPTPREEGLGLRSLIEEPDALTHGWWRDRASRGLGRSTPRSRAA